MPSDTPPLLGHRKRSGLEDEKDKRRIHKVAPWIKNPLQGVDKKSLVFAPRHEASTLELFFDLFFVANLATFTAYHSIVDHSSLFAYVGFFAIIWLTWFHITLHDVRFAHDTVYERACKTLQMIVFVGFALVGSAFAPGTDDGNNTNFRILCYTLVISRALFVVQYSIVAIFVVMARRTDILLPLALNILTYVVAGAAFGAMIPSFAANKPVDPNNGIYSVWWVVMGVETIATIGISSIWRMVSFKKTHLVERMGLLTLIVIGEGAIGVTKTISRMMGKNGLDPEGCGMILCIILLLIGLWMIYFDNHPHGHYGTIRQQIWSTLHFPIHLMIVGLVEGAQQIALARYTSRGITKLEKSFAQACFKDHLDGEKLSEKLFDAVEYFHLDKKLQGLIYMDEIDVGIWTVGNETGICGKTVTGSGFSDFPDGLANVFYYTVSAIYSALGLILPLDRDPVEVMFESWKLVYRYFWAAFLVLTVCFLICMILIRRNKMDVFDWTTLFSRGTAIVISGVLLALSSNHDLMYGILEKDIILPTAVVLLYLIIVLDRFSAKIANWRNRRSGEPLTGVGGHGHGHGGDEGHEGHDDHGGHGDDHEKGDGISLSVMPVAAHRMSYNPLGGAVMPAYHDTDAPLYGGPTVTYSQPPPGPGAMYAQQQPPPAMPVFSESTAYNPGGYMPVSVASTAQDPGAYKPVSAVGTVHDPGVYMPGSVASITYNPGGYAPVHNAQHQGHPGY
ncbi:bacterial low temperature requirement A protein-domain-containing protein [Lasiosphaeria ovina]|uniref:Bacterial low temperature requirement A protein-domain-containing protein n=1 Tax=Lasiosphaeria ovina TaxID=92902 RepID=A0AAE0KBC3_9PEZI|nr:bacterial low temperature requirement A protein-domain-containing protein [Lasiosphaeria ovina]